MLLSTLFSPAHLPNTPKMPPAFRVPDGGVLPPQRKGMANRNLSTTSEPAGNKGEVKPSSIDNGDTINPSQSKK